MTMFEAVQIGLSLIAVVVIVKALVRSKKWTLASTFIFVTAWLLNLTAVSKITGQLVPVRLVDPIRGIDSEVLDIRGASLALITYAPRAIIIFSILVLFFLSIKRRAKIVSFAPGAFILLIVVVASVSNSLNGGRLFSPTLLALCSLVIAATVIPANQGVWLGAASFGVSLSVVSAAVLMLNPQLAVTECSRKCGIFGEIYSGALLNENKYGLVLTICIPIAFFAFRGKSSLFLAFYLFVGVLSSGSRTAIIASLITIVVTSLVWFSTHTHLQAHLGFGAKCAAVIALVSALVCAVLPFVVSDPYAFTGRGQLWSVAKDRLSDSYIFGLGWGDWTRASEAGYFLGGLYGPHNEFLHVLNVAGAVGLLLFLCFFVSLLAGSGRAKPFLIPVLGAVLVVGIFEIPMSFFRLEWTSWLFPFLIIAARAGDMNGQNPALVTEPDRHVGAHMTGDTHGGWLKQRVDGSARSAQ